MTLSTDSTIKSKGGLLQVAENEVEIARKKFLAAYDAYIEQKTIVNRNAMYRANEELKRVKKLYREGRRIVVASILKTPRKQ